MQASPVTHKSGQTCVLIITTGLQTGGAEAMLVKLLSRLDRDIYRPVVLSLTNEGTLGQQVKNLGIELYSLNINGPRSLLTSILRLRTIVKAYRPDILQGWMYHGNIAAWLAKLFAGNGAVLMWNIRHSLHDLRLESLPLRFLIKLSAILSKKVDVCIFPSNTARSQHARLGFRSKGDRTIPNGFDLEYFRPATGEEKKTSRNLLRLSSDDIVVLHLARFHRMKNHIGFIQGVADVAAQVESLKVIMAGSGVSSENDALMREIDRFNLRDKVLLLGECRDVKSLYAAADFYCISSAWGEAFPNVLGEAMAMGLPSVSTDVGDCGYILGRFGLLVPSDDLRALSAALLKMATMPQEELRLLGLGGRDRVMADFSLEAVVRSYQDCYEASLDRKSATPPSLRLRKT